MGESVGAKVREIAQKRNGREPEDGDDEADEQ
jgi:hypothetical protein